MVLSLCNGVLHLTAFSLDTELPDYDLNSEDETFVNKLKKKMEITALQFEEMIDRLEKGSGKQVFAPAYTHLYCLYAEKEAKQVIFIILMEWGSFLLRPTAR